MKINKLLLLLILFLQAFTVCGAIGFTNDNTVPTYHYYTQDHLGNNRAVVNDNGTVEQITHYYPFGGTYADVGLNSSLQPYKYNGKELDRMHGLNWYEYGHRQYDPIVPMFTQIDPLAEKYYNFSPYVYCGNNPVKYIDLKGDSLSIDSQALRAIYNGLAKGSDVSIELNGGILNPSSIAIAASNTNDTFLQDLYEISKAPQMVELRVSKDNKYLSGGHLLQKEWDTPYELNDYDFNFATQEIMKQSGEPMGRHIQGNLGQTLFPSIGNKQSTNNNIQININGKGDINAQSIGIAHEFGHVLLYMRGLPHSHGKPGVDSFIYSKVNLISKRLGYDY